MSLPESQPYVQLAFKYDVSSPQSEDLSDGLPSEASIFKDIKWSRDGSALLCSQENLRLQSFSFPAHLSEEFRPFSTHFEAENILDFLWYPLFNCQDSNACCFLSSTRDHPVHLWNIYSNSIVCSYAAINHVEQVVAPLSLAFSLDGQKIYGGSENCFYVWETSRPGKNVSKHMTSPTRKSKTGQKGLISCIAINPDYSGLLVTGSFSGSLGLFDDKCPQCLISSLKVSSKDTQGGIGVSDMKFSTNSGKYLFSSHRKSNIILCWDVRKYSDVLYKLQKTTSERCSLSNQRSYFDLKPCDGTLLCGTPDGSLDFFDLTQGPSSCEERPDSCPVLGPSFSLENAHRDFISSTKFHPWLPLASSSSGQRCFALNESEEDAQETLCAGSEYSIKLWSLDAIKSES